MLVLALVLVLPKLRLKLRAHRSKCGYRGFIQILLAESLGNWRRNV